MAKGQTTKASQNKTAALLKVNSNSKPIKKDDKKSQPLKEHKWNRAKLTIGDFFSCHQYMQVIKIADSTNTVDLKNERGESVQMTLGVLYNDSYSANHFEKEVSCTMTELSEILKSAKDTIFQVEFKKKTDE